MVYRLYVEKKEGLANEATTLLSDIRTQLQIKSLNNLRLLNRYDVENIDKELFEKCINTVFSEPPLDMTYSTLPKNSASNIFAVEYLPGQYDQRADSAAQCIQLVSKGERPTVKTAKVFLLFGELTQEDVNSIKGYIINPVESREASLKEIDTLQTEYEIPTEVDLLEGFTQLDIKELECFLKEYALAMDIDDLKFCQDYFIEQKRNPTITEIRLLDTYWSDHCRHTTFLTTIDSVNFEDEAVSKMYQEYLAIRKELNRTKPINLMDIATIGAKYLKHKGLLEKLDESDEINACTVKIDVDVDGKTEKWLLLFKNETHNHPTEIEPFGGAATCIGGAIRDPLSGRAYVYQAMRVTGAGNPLVPVKDTLEGKLSQRKIVTTAANGYSSYGNQIGLATGQVDEIYHSGYIAKRMEIGAVVGATPAENVRREVPMDSDVVILLGGRTGRDGCGGATGSSKSHKLSSLDECGAEVQKGNAPEERKLQRLFRNPEASKLIKRCNDFGAGGISVAIGELADGLMIDLNAVKKKYAGLDGTELAISESQERMAVVIDKNDVNKFFSLAENENLEATVVAKVISEKRLIMEWNSKKIVDIDREFLNSNGAEKHTNTFVIKGSFEEKKLAGSFVDKVSLLAEDLNICSKKGLSERFDSTIGAGSVLMPFGGRFQLTPTQAMVAKIPVLEGETNTCSAMAWGYNPFIFIKSPFVGAYLSVIESVSKLVANGIPLDDCYLTFQEYFERLKDDPKRWGKPFSALLGALKAQLDLSVAAIGGKDSMSGSFEDIDVPPTLVSFAVSVGDAANIISPEFKSKENKVFLIKPKKDKNGLPEKESLKSVYDLISGLIKQKKVISAYTPTLGGVAEALLKMTFGNKIGFRVTSCIDEEILFDYCYGSFVVEANCDIEKGIFLGKTTQDFKLEYRENIIDLSEVLEKYENKLESVFPCNIENKKTEITAYNYETKKRIAPKISIAAPKVVIPVFPGTNCEYDTKAAMKKAGADASIFVINNLSSKGVAESVKKFAGLIESSQIIFIPGGFSGGDEPDGSGKFITAFFRNPIIKDCVHRLLKQRDGLIGGICNGFQALIKLGLVPFGEILEPDESFPTLTYNTIGRHQSKIVNIRVASNLSPWFSKLKTGDVFSVPISHGEGRFLCDEALLNKLAINGQIATQYVDLDNKPTMDIRFNPNGSVAAIEGITSPDGRVLGKMGHSERIGNNLYKNVSGNYDMGLFKSAVEYFSL